jgi:phosphoglycerate dehydrogenase-like enzyme/glyoxylase-like metal-dependent hydrolase (beta-lactamase superfamily II)
MHPLYPLLVLLAPCAAPPAQVLPMKFDQVKEVAPGVFFRYSAISPSDPNVFGGSNNVWVVFEDYVVVIDANFPKEAGDVLAAIKKTTNKPVRYVLDTHHHGDHAWGNAVWVKAGATIVAHANCAKLMREGGEAEFVKAGEGPNGRKDVARSVYKVPTLTFEDRLVLDDGKQRVEFLHLGHSHTIGDAVAYLPRHKILCTGDACVNGPYNFMGHSDSASWIRCLEKMQQLDVELVLPGHGLAASRGLLEKQKRYFIDLRKFVKKGIDDGKEVADLLESIDLPWYKEWTTVRPAAANVEHVYKEYLGLVAPWDFALDYGIYEGPSPSKDDRGWTKPRKIVIPAGLSSPQLESLKKAAPEIEFLPAKTPQMAAKLAAQADAVIGFATPEVIEANRSLRWVHSLTPGVTSATEKALKGNKVTLTDVRRVDAPAVADQTFALILALTRNLSGKTKLPPVELRGKTMLVIGFGGTGEQIARRASAFGTKVIALDDSATERPSFVFALRKMDRLDESLKEADVVVLALPLTERTRGVIGKGQLAKMKKGAILVDAAHAGLVDLTALTEAARSRQIAGAGLDVTDVGESLIGDHPLGKLANVVLTANAKEAPAEVQERRWRLLRENVRRFAAGERLLGVVPR